MKVSNIYSNSGNPIANQFEIVDGDKRYFQSYDSIIAVIENLKVTLDEYYWNYSTTTGKYRNIFLGEDRKATEKKIKDGTYKLANLNLGEI